MCRGDDLGEVLLKKGRLKEINVYKIMKQVFYALNYIHSLGFVHRDIKPDNIMTDEPEEFDQIFICDFGSCTKCEEG